MYNPYFIQQPYQNQFTQYVNPIGNINKVNSSSAILQGKSVDSLDVVKAMDIPLDGSISYFPLVDGSMIATKQLQQDGSSKILVYQLTELNTETPEYATVDKVEELLKNDNKDMKEELKTLKRQLRNIIEDIEDRKVK